jgi:hypothetical protein
MISPSITSSGACDAEAGAPASGGESGALSAQAARNARVAAATAAFKGVRFIDHLNVVMGELCGVIAALQYGDLPPESQRKHSLKSAALSPHFSPLVPRGDLAV